MSATLVDYFKSIPDVLKTIPPSERIGALGLILFLIVLLTILRSKSFTSSSSKTRKIAILMIIRYGFIGTGILCGVSFAAYFVSFKSESAEISKAYYDSRPPVQINSDASLRPIISPDAIKNLADSLVVFSRQPDAPAGTADAVAQLKAGNPSPMIAILQDAAKRQSDKAAQAEKLRQAGLLAFYKDTQIAINLYQQSLELDPNNWETWSQLSYLLERQGNHAAARAAAQKVLDIGNAGHDPKILGAGYAALGYIEASAGRAGTAKELLEKGRGNFLAAGANVEFARATNNLAQVTFSQGNYDTAMRLYEEALSYDSVAKNQRGVASDYVGLAQIFTALGQADKATDYLNKALPIDRDIDDFHQQAVTLSAIGTLYQNAGNLDAAKASFTSALNLDKSLGNLAGQIFDTGNLAKIASLMNDYEGAESKYLEAIDMAKKGDSRFLEAVMQRGIGTLYSNQKKYPLAVAAFNRAIEIDRDLNRTKYQALDLKSLGWVFGQQNQKSEACSSWKEAQDLLRKITAETELESVQKAAADEIESLQKAAADMACHD